MILTIGTSTVDFFVSGLGRIPAFGGDEFHVDNLTFCTQPAKIVCGGNGANSAYVLGKLGAQVVLSSAVGHDQPGDIVFTWLSDQGVALVGLKRSDTHATATNTIITDDALSRISMYHPGASDDLYLADIPANLLQQANIVLYSGYPLLPALRADAQQVFATAREHGAITAIDIGPAIGRPAKLDELIPLLPEIDYFITNDYELSVCTGDEELEANITRLLDAGANHVLVKRGAEGALVRGRDVNVNIPGFPVEAKFTVGAGDSFNSGFLYGVEQGWDLARAITFGNATAALVVSSGRGILGCPTIGEVEQLLQAD